VSSTVYDLIDTRAEVCAMLRELGVTPVLSDDKLTDFQVCHDVNSIETCLVNVAASDEMILMLDRRYGPRLGEYGFPDLSATHLEYRKALELKKPIHFFVRDRLDADYAIWKRNGRTNTTKLTWVGQHDLGLLELLDERAKLATDSKSSNWYATFIN